MAEIELIDVTKSYGTKTAVDGVSLTVKDNEFFVLFGPAGAGKTSLLKVIAGIEFPQKGLVKINGEIVNHVEPMNRNVSMVFENYALYPHMNVYDNIASPMRSRLYRQSEDHIKSEVDRVTRMMRINHLLERRPGQLSNGQRQRVAIGRGLVRKPNVFLMDEPLAHLDAKLRHFMRRELKEMQSNFNTTTIYVTHDYMEAMSLADRIAVVNEGRIVQIGSAGEMYYLPCNEFVARLFGEPEINIFSGVFKLEEGRGMVGAFDREAFLETPGEVREELEGMDGKPIDIGIRGSDISFSFERQDSTWIRATVYANEPIGNKVIMTVVAGDSKLEVAAPNDTQAVIDQEVYLKFNMANALYFDHSSKEFITRANRRRYEAKSRLGGR
ncbi:ABC transporter ATP-binding protein [Lachnospiraceae bacterium 54-53]